VTGNRRVLVIDDDLDLLETYRQILGERPARYGEALRNLIAVSAPPDRAPFDFDSAINGEQGIQKVERAVAENRPYAMVMIDVHMPPGKDGVETLREIRNIDMQIMAVLISAYSERTIDEIQQAGEYDVLLANKPLGQEELYQLARNGCSSWQRAEALRRSRLQLEQQNRQMQESSHVMEALLSRISEGVARFDKNNRINAINPALLSQLGRPLRTLLGRRIEEVEQPLQAQGMVVDRFELPDGNSGMLIVRKGQNG
jgi:CheY-like chemotaxis protein